MNHIINLTTTHTRTYDATIAQELKQSVPFGLVEGSCICGITRAKGKM